MGSQCIVDQRIYQESSRDIRVKGKREGADVPPQNYRDHVRKMAAPYQIIENRGWIRLCVINAIS